MIKPNKPNKMYVAFSYRLGVACNSKGERFGTYHVFNSADERDSFVASGGNYRTQSDWRESIPSGDAEWRRRLGSIKRHVSDYGTWESACEEHFVALA
jgi:hypothetical protein